MYGSRTVLASVSLVAGAGELTLVLGPSGSGKSSLIMCLAGLLRPSSGEVRLDGVGLYGASASDCDALRRRHMGLVTQHGDLVPELTVVENVALPLRLGGVSARAAKVSALGALDRFGIGEIEKSEVDEISGGQWQRAAIARALVHEPTIVLADEPTAALDDVNARRVIAELRSYASARGAAVIVATHDLRFASFADRSYSVLDGCVEVA